MCIWAKQLSFATSSCTRPLILPNDEIVGDSSGCVLLCISSTSQHSILYTHFKHSVAYISKNLTCRKQNTCIIHRFSPTDFPTKQAFSLTVSCPVSEPLKSGLYLGSGRMERDNNRERSEKYTNPSFSESNALLA